MIASGIVDDLEAKEAGMNVGITDHAITAQVNKALDALLLSSPDP